MIDRAEIRRLIKEAMEENHRAMWARFGTQAIPADEDRSVDVVKIMTGAIKSLSALTAPPSVGFIVFCSEDVGEREFAEFWRVNRLTLHPADDSVRVVVKTRKEMDALGIAGEVQVFKLPLDVIRGERQQFEYRP